MSDRINEDFWYLSGVAIFIGAGLVGLAVVLLDPRTYFAGAAPVVPGGRDSRGD